MSTAAREEPRLAEVLAALSLATDLGNGAALEKALRTTLLAMAVADELGANEAARGEVYLAALVRNIGCTAFALEEAAAFGGDDIGARRRYRDIDPGRAVEVLAALASSPRDLGVALRGPGKLFASQAAASCEAGARLAARLGMPAGVCDALAHAWERWDGGGAPRGLAGEAIAFAARVVRVADAGEGAWARGGVRAARATVARRAGRELDPRAAKAFERAAPAVLEGFAASTSVWDTVLAAEPGPRLARIAPARLEDVARAFGDFADLKSAHRLGHANGVATLADAAAVSLGIDDATRATLRLAAWLHDLGIVSVPTGVWDKPGALTAAEWERVRLHPYYTERVLARAPSLARAAAVASAHHERLDGSGYFRGAARGALDRPARVLAAADALYAMTASRAHRPALAPDAAARALRADAAAGRLDGDAVAAVLAAAGHAASRAAERALPAGLSAREVEVLVHVARGRSNKEVARELTISPRTVQHHVMHIYAKIGVATRAGAALFAMEHELVAASER